VLNMLPSRPSMTKNSWLNKRNNLINLLNRGFYQGKCVIFLASFKLDEITPYITPYYSFRLITTFLKFLSFR
jgi:hypothetical protein